MSTDELLKRLRPIVDEWPVGTVVWHRASGHRGIIVEYAIDGVGCVMILVDYGKGPWEKEMPCVLSGSKVSDGTDGDEWKDGTGKEGTGV